MGTVFEYFTSKWRRPKHKGVSGNLSTVIIMTGIVIGSYIMSGGGYPEVYRADLTNPRYGKVYPNQPQHSKETGLTLRELRMGAMPTGKPTAIPTFGPTATPTPTPPEAAPAQ